MTADNTAQLLVSQMGGTYIPIWYQKVAVDDEMSLDRPRKGSSISCDSVGLQLKIDEKDSSVNMSVSGEDAAGSRRYWL